MLRDKLYDAAFRYRKTKIWNKLWDSELFAVRLKSGETGFVCIMGHGGDYCGLDLYIGEAGVRTYLKVAEGDLSTGSEFKDHELLLQQNCLQLVLENKEDLMPAEIEEVRAFAKQNHINISGNRAYPRFLKYEPGRHPWGVSKEEDMDALCEAMDVAVLLADILKNVSPERLGISPIGPDTPEVPLFEIREGKLLQTGFAPLPPDSPEVYEYIKAEDEIALAAVRKLQKKGIWETELVMMLNPAQEDPNEAPYYPFMLMTVDKQTQMLLPKPIIARNESEFPDMIQTYADAWKSLKIRPEEVRCRDERTYALLKDFSEKTGVKIRVYNGELPALDDAEDSFYDYTFGEDEENEEDMEAELESIAAMILSLNKQELRQIPGFMLENIKQMLSDGLFPEETADKLRKKLKGM